MKTLKTYWFVAFWLLAALPALAQRPADPNWTFYLSLHGSQLTRDPQLLGAGAPLLKPGGSVGISRNFQIIPKTLGIHVGTRYTSLGFRSDARVDSARRKSSTRLHYLEIPADVVLQLGGERTRLYLSAGPYVSFGLGGKRTYREENFVARADSATNRIVYVPTTSSKLTFRPMGNDLKRLDYGLNLALGIRRQYTVFGFTYKHGLADLSNTAAAGSTFTRSYGLFLTYFFDDAF